MTTSTILQYYEGILRQLRSQVDDINDLFRHPGLKGHGNEEALRNLIRRFLPKQYGIDTGVVIDKDGNQSRQCDIIVYDNQKYPSLLALTNIHMFPVDLVYAVIEVKTTLSSQSAKEALANIASVRNLNHIKERFVSPQPTPDGGWAVAVYNPTPPLGFVFGYNSSAQQFETFKQWFIPPTDTAVPSFPSLVGCLDQGILFFHAPNGGFSIHPEVGLQFQGLLPALFNDRNVPITVESTRAEYVQDGKWYPTKTVNGLSAAIDQSRALLQFLLILHLMLSGKHISENVNLGRDYFAGTSLFNGIIS